MNYQILVVLERVTNNYSAYAPDVPGCIATGKTREQTLERMRGALKAHLKLMARDGDPMPEISAEDAEFIGVDVDVDVSLATANSQS